MSTNWVDLPQDLLVTICSFLMSPDRITLQSVCKPWRATLKDSSNRLRELPWLLMLREEDPDAFDFFSLSKQKIFTIRLPGMRGKRCCGSFQNGWLMTMDLDFNINLFHPWSKKTLQLPHEITFKRNYGDEERPYYIEYVIDVHTFKAALSDDARMVVIICGIHSALWMVGDNVWNVIEEGTPMEDVIYHNGQFYSVSRSGSLCLHLLCIGDGSHPWWKDLTEHFGPRNEDGSNTWWIWVFYLVPDIFTDSMFVIMRSTITMDEKDDQEDKEYSDEEGHSSRRITDHFEIYKIPLGKGEPNNRLKKITEEEGLEDTIVFLGYNSSMIFMRSEFPGFKGNHIYFGAHDWGEGRYGYGYCDLGVFNVENGTVEHLFIDRFHPMSSPPLWIATPPYSFQRDFGEKLRLE